jgi:hypothetical protein
MTRRQAIIILVAALVGTAALQAQFPAMTPTLEFKTEATLKGATANLTIEALRATQRMLGLRGMSLRNKGKISIPRVMGVAPTDLKSISMSLPLTDVPDGGIYIVRLEEDKEGWAFDSEPERSSRPGDKSIIFRPSELKVEKKEGGSYEFELPHPLSAGKYAIAITNNQYAWGFEVK